MSIVIGIIIAIAVISMIISMSGYDDSSRSAYIWGLFLIGLVIAYIISYFVGWQFSVVFIVTSIISYIIAIIAIIYDIKNPSNYGNDVPYQGLGKTYNNTIKPMMDKFTGNDDK